MTPASLRQDRTAYEFASVQTRTKRNPSKKRAGSRISPDGSQISRPKTVEFFSQRTDPSASSTNERPPNNQPKQYARNKKRARARARDKEPTHRKVTGAHQSVCVWEGGRIMKVMKNGRGDAPRGVCCDRRNVERSHFPFFFFL